MKPSRLAVAWCLYTILFFITGRPLHIYIPGDGLYSKLSKHLEPFGYYVWEDLYGDILLLLSVFLCGMVIMLTAKPACRFINKNLSDDIKAYQVTPLKLFLILHAFAAMYVVVISLTLTCMPEVELYKKISRPVDDFMLKAAGEYTNNFLSLPFSLLIMSIIVALVSSFAIRLPCFRKRRNHSPNSN